MTLSRQFFESLLEQISALETRLAILESREPLAIGSYSENDVGNPPTLEQIEGALGASTDVGTGAIGVINDNGAGSNVWFCVSLGSDGWWYEALTAAS